MNNSAYDTEMHEGSALDGVELAPENALQDEPAGHSLEEVLAMQQDNAEQTKSTETAPVEPQGKEKSEPGWIKGRINEGVRKEVARIRGELEATLRAEYEQQLRPMREALLDRQADDLVASGKITDKAMALDYLRMQHGLPAVESAQSSEQPRNEKGQFVPRQPQQNTEPDTETQQYGQMLFAQAKAIQAAGGPNVMAAYEKDAEIRQRILSREWDFSDVAQHLRQRDAGSSAPPPIRAANSQGPTSKQIMDMTDEEFDRLNAQLGKGARVDLRK